MILLKIENHFLKNHVLQQLSLLPIFLGQNKNYKASCSLRTGKNWELISFLFPETSLLRKYPENSPGNTAKHRHIVKSFQEAI